MALKERIIPEFYNDGQKRDWMSKAATWFMKGRDTFNLSKQALIYSQDPSMHSTLKRMAETQIESDGQKVDALKKRRDDLLRLLKENEAALRRLGVTKF